MLRFAFHGRVSTEDQQDLEASRNWQVARAQTLNLDRERVPPDRRLRPVAHRRLARAGHLPLSI
jgi:hypothetical protein